MTDTKRGTKPWVKRSRLFLAAILVFFISSLWWHRPLLIFFGSVPIVEDSLEPADLIVVFSGGIPDVKYGVDLYHKGYAPRLLFLGHFPVELAVICKEPFQVIERPWDEISAQLAINAGVAREDLLFSDAFNHSTYERVESAIVVARENGVESAIFVGHLLHSRRVKFSASKILAESPFKVFSAPTPQSYYPEAYQFELESWWTDETHLRAVLGEYIRLIFYWINYGL